MIHAFSVENFKSLKTERVDLSPLTILSGINNSGKTTFIKSILELFGFDDEKSNVLSGLPILSNYTTKVFNNDTSNNINFHMKIDLNDDEYIELNISFKYSKKVKGGFPYYYKFFTKKGDKNFLLELSKDNPEDYYKIHSSLGLALLFGKVKENVDLPKVFSGIGDVKFIGFLPVQCILKFKDNNILYDWFDDDDDDNQNIQLAIKSSNELLESIFNVKYIGPLRNHPKEFYFFEYRGLKIDSRGENTFEVLDRIQNRNIKFFASLDSNNLVEKSLIDAINYWIEFFYGNAKLDLIKISENLVQVMINGHSINNSGFGFSQLIPIIVQALLLKKNELLLLEQPEIHLHPELEYKLAYFLLCIAKNKRQIIAETHSEHIINQLILSKMKDETGKIDKIFKIYFLEKDVKGITKFEKVLISEYGEIENWPKGFFDQYLNFTKELVKLRKEKALKNRVN